MDEGSHSSRWRLQVPVAYGGGGGSDDGAEGGDEREVVGSAEAGGRGLGRYD